MGTVIAGAPYGSRSRSRIPAWIRVWIFRPRDRLNTVSLSDKSFPSIWEILFSRAYSVFLWMYSRFQMAEGEAQQVM